MVIVIQIKSLHFRIQHESIPLSEEKQILREIKQLEGTREKVIAQDAMRAKIQDLLGEKEVIQDQVKVRQFFFFLSSYSNICDICCNFFFIKFHVIVAYGS